MSLSGDVIISVADGGGSAVVVPGSSVQVKIGCANQGTDYAIVATRSLKTLTDTFDGGPLVEAAGLAILAGAVCICIKVPTNTAGYVQGSANPTVAISTASTATPIVVTTAAPHLLVTGDVVTVAGVTGNAAANGTFVATVTGASTFTIPPAGVGSGTGGTVQFDGVIQSGTGTSVVTATGAALDRFFIQIDVVSGATIGVAGATFTVSLDAGRTKGPTIALGTPNTYLIPGTGITLHFAAGTLVAGDRIRLSTVGPLWNEAGIAAAKNALKASGYATTGFGAGMHIVGYSTAANAATFEANDLDDLATGYIFTRAILDFRDAHEPQAWGGAGETEAVWTAALAADVASTSAKRIWPAASEWNMPSAFTNAVAGAPRYRRPLAWAFAARQAAISPQRHAGRRRPDAEGGPLSQIVVDPTNDPNDGFIYHDERVNPGLDPFVPGGASRFTTARTVIGLPGVFITNPISLAPNGSDYVLAPRGRVMDLACFIVHQVGQNEINDDVRVNDGSRNTVAGTIDERDAKRIEASFAQALSDQMVSPGYMVSATVTVDRTVNISLTSKVKVTIRITGKGYILELDLDIGFANANAAT
jgi:hypothetical protein